MDDGQAGNHRKIDGGGAGRPRLISGRGLRFVLVAELMRRPEATVAELVVWLSEQGYLLPGRASKVISDSLRWEVRRGRVSRLGRGRYRYCRAPASTARRIRLLADRCRVWIGAVMESLDPPQTPPDPRATYRTPAYDSWDPPWRQLGWLWAS